MYSHKEEEKVPEMNDGARMRSLASDAAKVSEVSERVR